MLRGQIMLAICGCSWASDFDSADYIHDIVTTPNYGNTTWAMIIVYAILTQQI